MTREELAAAIKTVLTAICNADNVLHVDGEVSFDDAHMARIDIVMGMTELWPSLVAPAAKANEEICGAQLEALGKARQ